MTALPYGCRCGAADPAIADAEGRRQRTVARGHPRRTAFVRHRRPRAVSEGCGVVVRSSPARPPGSAPDPFGRAHVGGGAGQRLLLRARLFVVEWPCSSRRSRGATRGPNLSRRIRRLGDASVTQIGGQQIEYGLLIRHGPVFGTLGSQMPTRDSPLLHERANQ